MGADTIREILGRLQADSEPEELWASLAEEASDASAETAKLLAAARAAHARRGEWDAVVRLLKMELSARVSAEDEHELLAELARVQQHELLDESGAMTTYRRMLERDSDDELLLAAVAESDERRGRWREMAQSYLQEAEAAPDDIYKASMLMRAAEMEWRYADEPNCDHVLGLLAQAAEADPKNTTVLHMLERVYRFLGKFEALPSVLERWSQAAQEPVQALAPALRLARLLANRVGDREAAAHAYELALQAVPTLPESKEWLVSHYAETEDWDRLVLVYERGLTEQDLGRPDRVGDMLQIALLHHKKRQNESDALAWFERIRAVEPTNAAMLDFYREYCAAAGEEGLLLDVLRHAQRVLPGGDEKNAVTQEIAQLAEQQEDAQQAIEQYKALLRQDPDNAEARNSLKALYRKTQGYHQLVDLLQHELERVSESDTNERLRLLSEVASVYRDHIPHDTSLVSALNQMLKLDDRNVAAVRELIGLYARLERWRDLLTSQQRLSVLSTDEEERVALLRDSGRRWLEQFSNVQNATLAFEALLELRPTDREARDTLASLYKKRRAWPALFKLYELQVATLEGPQRVAVMKEMAELAADRLGNRDTAAKLYRQILDSEPSNVGVLDALERQAERAKDWATLASALEHRSQLDMADVDRVAVLQKLGAVYQDHVKASAKAIETWQRVLSLQPGHSRALRVLRDAFLAKEDYEALETLFAEQGDYESLAEVLSNTADRATDIRAKIDLSYRAARVFEANLHKPERAFRSYERILAVDPFDTKAARALLPLYERDEKWARLPALYELLIDDASDKDEKLSLYERLIDVTAQRLSDKKGAVEFARKAYELDPERPDALSLFEQACSAADSWEPFAQALEARLLLHRDSVAPPPKGGRRRRRGKAPAQAAAAATGDDALTDNTVRRLELSLAHTYAERLERLQDAVTTYKRLLESHPEDLVAGSELETLLDRMGATDELRWLYGFRVENASSDEQALSDMRQWARAEEERFGDPARAAELHRRILEQHPGDDDSLVQLARLLLSLGENEDALGALNQRRALLQGEALAELEVEIAAVLLQRLGRPQDALEACVRAIELGSEAEAIVEMLRSLSEASETKARAREVLAEVYHRAGESRREAEALVALLATESDPVRRLEVYVRAVGVYEQLDSYGAAFDTMLRACREFPQRIELWERVGTLSEQAARPTELLDVYRDVLQQELPPETTLPLCQQAAALVTEQLGDPAGAAPYLERVLQIDPANEVAFTSLKQILTSNQRWGELQGLYDRMIEAVDDPAGKLAILSEVAMVTEEFVEDSAKAVHYYEAMQALDPDSQVALAALDRLYVQHDEVSLLEKVLIRRLALESNGHEATSFRLRLAELYLDRLHQPEHALPHLGAVLGQDVNDLRARELTERVLGIGSLRGEAAEILEPVYLARDQIRDLVRVLEVRVDVLRQLEERSDEQELQYREMLARLAELMDERLRDDEGTLRVLSEYVPLVPSDELARDKLVASGRRLSAPSQVAGVLTLAGENSPDAITKGELWLLAGDLLDGDSEAAEPLYRRVLSVMGDAPELARPAARALERIFAQADDHAELVANLRVQLGLCSDPDERAQLLGRIAQLCETKLDDLDAAIAAWKERLETDAADSDALSALDRLYEKAERWKELVGILEVRRDHVAGADERHVLMARAARVFADRLTDPTSAIFTYRAMLDETGPDEAVLEPLEVLLRQEERWEELVDACEMHLSLPLEAAQRVALQTTIGELQFRRLSDIPRALEAFDSVLGQDSANQVARVALEEVMLGDDRLHSRQAAQILVPVQDAGREWEALLKSHRVLADTAELVDDRLSSLNAALDVVEERLEDRGRAFDLVAEAVTTAAGHADLRPWLEQLARLSEATGRFSDECKLLQQIAAEIFDGDVQFDVTLKIARLALEQLHDSDLALEYFQRAVELRSDSDESLAALETLYREKARFEDLLTVLERRTDLAATSDVATALLFKRAALLDETLERPEQASQALEAILDRGYDEKAASGLIDLYTRLGRWEELVEIHQRRLDQAGVDSCAVRVAIADVAAWRLGDPFRAFEHLEAALQVEPQHGGVITALERLMADAGEAQHRAHAAGILEPIYLARADYDRVIQSRSARLDYTDAPEERRNLLSSLAQLYEEQKEDYPAAFETVARLLHEDLDDEHTIGELERLARVADKADRLAEVYSEQLEDLSGDEARIVLMARRAGELYRDAGDLERGLRYFRQAYDYETEDRSLFDAIDELLTRLGRPAERVELYQGALAVRTDTAERITLMHSIAELQAVALSNKSAAIETYRDLLSQEPEDKTALDTVSRLYYETERFEDLYDLVLSRAEAAPDQRKAADYRLALARLCREQLQDDVRALDQLEEVLEADPRHAEALDELEAYRKQPEHTSRVVDILRPVFLATDSWRHQISLNEDRFRLAPDVAEQISVLCETAGLWERRAGEPVRALHVLAEAVRLAPDDDEVRAEFERVVELTGQWDELASVYGGLLAENTELLRAPEMWARLARCHDESRDDPRAALKAYAELHKVDPSDVEVVERMESLATLLSDWEALDWVLVAKAGLSLSDEEQASIWRRVAEGRSDMLGNAPGAIEAYEQALLLEPDSVFTLDCLIPLLETEPAGERLVDLYLARVDLAEPDDSEVRFDMLQRAAACFQGSLGEPARAIELYVRALEERPDHPETLAALSRLYEQEQFWPELLETLTSRAAQARDPESRAELNRRRGEVLATKLESYDEALEAFQLVLQDASHDLEAQKSVRGIGEEHVELRERMGAILLPALEHCGDFEQVVQILELRLESEGEGLERARTLRQMARVLEQELASPERAHAALLRAMAEVPEDDSVHAELERTSATKEAWTTYADALAERAGTLFDTELAKDLYVRLGTIADAQLQDLDRAIAAYRSALDQVGDTPELLATLDRLLLRAKRWQTLAEVLERRTVLSESDAERAGLFSRLGLIQIDEFDEVGQGLESLRAALELDNTREDAVEKLEALMAHADLFDEVADALEQVYRGRGDVGRLTVLGQRRVDHAQTADERLDMRKNLAKILDEEMADSLRAQRVLEQALGDAPDDESLLFELERLAQVTGDWAGLAAAVKVALSNDAVAPEAARDLCVRAAGWYSEPLRDPEAAEGMLREALAFDRSNEDVLLRLESLQRGAGHESARVETLRARARLQFDESVREELFREAFALAESISEHEMAAGVVEELLAIDPANAWALGTMAGRSEAAGNYEDAVSYMLRLADTTFQGDELLVLKHRAAEICRMELANAPRAIELYESLFEDDVSDRRASNALMQLYAQEHRTQQQSELLLRLVEVSDDPAERSRLRLELAELQLNSFDDAQEAMNTLRDLLFDDPDHAAAAVMLAELYQREGRLEPLAELLQKQADAAIDRGDTAAQLEFELRLAKLFEGPLADLTRAAETYLAVLDRDGTHLPAMEALTRLYLEAGDDDSAADMLVRRVELSEGSTQIELAEQLAQLHLKSGHSDRAIETLEFALAQAPREEQIRQQLRSLYGEAGAWDRLGELLAGDAMASEAPAEQARLLAEAARVFWEKTPDMARAAELLEKASELCPEDRSVLLQLCEVYTQSDRSEDAVRALQQVVESYGGRRSRELGEVHRRLAEAYLSLGNTELATEELNNAFRIEPGNVLVLKMLGQLSLEAGDLKRAQQMFRALRLEKLDADSPITEAEVFYYLGVVHHRMDDLPRAKSHLKSALRLAPDMQPALELLAAIEGA